MEFKEHEYNNLYPLLEKIAPSAPSDEQPQLVVGQSAHVYRLQKINEIQKELLAEREKRNKLSKKYHRAVKIISGVDDALIASTLGLGIAGVTVLSTNVAAPVAMAMEGAALGAGLLCIIGKQVNKKLTLKAEKHEKIKVLADTKLNTISDHILQALKDDIVSDEEYSLIISELEKFNSMKEEIRSKIKIGIDKQTKQSLIEQGKEEAIENLKKNDREVFIWKKIRTILIKICKIA